ncbi:hypothetical protein O6H91_Y048900 [Diphasiastrum complanatum]|nr:hypothetical protein O6H91_Y048900 [Diphasiastrum complanatum]
MESRSSFNIAIQAAKKSELVVAAGCCHQALIVQNQEGAHLQLGSSPFFSRIFSISPHLSCRFSRRIGGGQAPTCCPFLAPSCWLPTAAFSAFFLPYFGRPTASYLLPYWEPSCLLIKRPTAPSFAENFHFLLPLFATFHQPLLAPYQPISLIQFFCCRLLPLLDAHTPP